MERMMRTLLLLTSNMLHSFLVSATMFFVLVFLATLQISYNQEIGRSPIYPCPSPCSNPNLDPVPLPQPEYVVIPQSPATGSIFANAPTVALFTRTFLDAVDSTDILREVLDLSQTDPKLYADFVSRYTYKGLIERNIPNAEALAEWITRAIFLYIDVLPLPIVARAYANFCANYLFVGGYLNISNAQTLALAYAQFYVDSANAYLTSDPTSKFLVLVRGYENFLYWLLEDVNAEAPFVTWYVGNEWFLAAVNNKFI